MLVYCITNSVSLCPKTRSHCGSCTHGHASHLRRGSIKRFKAHFVSVSLCFKIFLHESIKFKIVLTPNLCFLCIDETCKINKLHCEDNREMSALEN